MKLRISAADTKLSPRNGAGWWLEVAWRFDNRSATPLYVLTKGPISMQQGEPFVLNHTATASTTVSGNIAPEMGFTTVAANSSQELRLSYPLPPMDGGMSRAVVGAFAVSATPPDLNWIPTHAWEAVTKWQSVVESETFQLRLVP